MASDSPACDAARSEFGAGQDPSRSAREHLASCVACRKAMEASARGGAILARVTSDPAASPDPAALDRLAAEVCARFARRSPLRFALPVAAAAAIAVAAFLVGRAQAPSAASHEAELAGIGSAAHERRVFDEIRKALGDDVLWAATNDGALATGLHPAANPKDLRVVFLELRDATGRVLARPRVVLPDGHEILVSVAGAPELRLVATREANDAVALKVTVTFEDGAALSAAAVASASGPSVALGEVRTHGAPVAVYVAAD